MHFIHHKTADSRPVLRVIIPPHTVLITRNTILTLVILVLVILVLVILVLVILGKGAFIRDCTNKRENMVLEVVIVRKPSLRTHWTAGWVDSRIRDKPFRLQSPLMRTPAFDVCVTAYDIGSCMVQAWACWWRVQLNQPCYPVHWSNCGTNVCSLV